jgi:hypothetical protein
VFGQSASATTHSVPIKLPRSCVLTLILASAPIIILGVYMPQPLHRLLEMAAGGLSR